MGEIYAGISLRLQARGNNVEKIFSVHPGADPHKIRLNITGAKTLRLTPQGELDVDTGAGSMRFTKPVAYQRIDGKKTTVDVAYTVNGSAYGFELAAYDTSEELIIDPLIRAVFKGVPDEKTLPTCIAADSDGNIYVAGISAGQFAVFKFDSRLETLLTSAIFGSRSSFSYHEVHDIAVDHQGAIYIAGSTRDENFPVMNGAFDTEFDITGWDSEAAEGFIIKYNGDLNTILASTYIGVGNLDAASGLAIDPDNNVYVVGHTTDPVTSPESGITPFPTTPGAYDTNPGGFRNRKAFVALLDSDLQNLLAATLLGDNGDVDQRDDGLDDKAYAVAIDEDGNVVVAGGTESKNFPVTDNCVDAQFQGETEAFISKFNPTLQNLLASTFLGGANDEKINALEIDPNNEIVVAGWTRSSDFPVVAGCYDTSYNLYEDGFVSRLRNDLTSLSASTFLGGDGIEQVSDMVIGSDGSVGLVGGTGSSNFPVTENAHDSTFNGFGYTYGESDFHVGDGFITILDQALARLSGSTYLGGHSKDHITSVLVSNDDIIVAGETNSNNFPYMIEVAGRSDAFFCRFHPSETPEDLPSARPGHWQSNDSGSASNIHLDIDICDDGSFKGIWRGYFCIIDLGCFISDDLESFLPKPVYGTMDFKHNTGTLTLGEDCKDLPISILRQTPDKLHVGIHEGGDSEHCLEGFTSYLDYQGQSEDGKCQVGPDVDGDDDGDDGDGGDDDDDDDDGDEEKEGGGGGGGGCFLNIMGGI
jgi:hypothetical protein